VTTLFSLHHTRTTNTTTRRSLTKTCCRMVRADTPLRINRVVVEGQWDGRMEGGREGRHEGMRPSATEHHTHIDAVHHHVMHAGNKRTDPSVIEDELQEAYRASTVEGVHRGLQRYVSLR